MSIAEWLQFVGNVTFWFMVVLTICVLILAFSVLRYVAKRIKDGDRDE